MARRRPVPRGANSSASMHTVPPILHAVGGSLGSALALLLFYPLERARIEMQSNAPSERPTLREKRSDKQGDKLEKRSQVVQELQKDGGEDRVANPADAPTDDSWVQCNSKNDNDKNKDDDIDDGSWSISSSSSEEEPATSRRSEVVSCLVGLHKRGELYRGVSPVITTMAASNFVFFYAHAAAKRYLLSSPKTDRHSLSRSLLASSVAGIVNVLVTNPLWVANLRIVHSESSRSSLFAKIQHIVRNEGTSHLWNGTWASLLLVSNPVIQFVAYEQLKTNRLSKRRRTASNFLRRTPARLTPVEAFVLGAFAKAAATVVTYPLQLAQVLLRLQRKRQKQRDDEAASNETVAIYNGTLDCFQKLFRTGGIPALFKGIEAKLLQTGLTAAFTFLTYEQILRVVRALYQALAKRRRRTQFLAK